MSHVAEAAYFRIAESGFRPGAIIDIGAFRGDWTRLIAPIFPNTPILMCEAQSEKETVLIQVKKELANCDYEICLLGKNEGEPAVFHVMETGSSLYSELSNVARTQRRIETRTLDSVMANRPTKVPLFLKLDVQGAELDILSGGPKTLEAAEIVQLEVALMQYNDGAPTANTVFNFMENRGFAIMDICGFVRPNPAYLSQIDVIFTRTNSKLRTDKFIF